MSDKKLTLIVSVDDYAFNLAKEKQIYACPASYGRDRGDYIAFYQTKPKQAITHYAKVKEITDDSDKLTSGDKIRMFPKMEAESTVFKLGELQEFEEPVEKDTYAAVQGHWYRDLEELKSAHSLSELTDTN